MPVAESGVLVKGRGDAAFYLSGIMRNIQI
jgi:hypothetical protein